MKTVKVEKIAFLCKRKMKRYARSKRFVKMPFPGDLDNIGQETYIDGLLYNSVTLYIDPRTFIFRSTGDEYTLTSFSYREAGKTTKNLWFPEGTNIKHKRILKLDETFILHEIYALYKTKKEASKARLLI